MGARYLAFERRDRHIQRAHITRRSGGAHRELAVRKTFAGIERSAQKADEPIRVREKVAERAAARLVQAKREEILRGDVGVDRTQLRVEHDDAGRERIEQVRWIEVREGGG